MQTLQIHPRDNILIALEPLTAGTTITVGTKILACVEDIPQGHKIALGTLKQGEPIIKYGHTIGQATTAIAAGTWVHTHNLATNLQDQLDYYYTPATTNTAVTPDHKTFMGYCRANGKVGTRNEIWIINTVGCVNTTAQRIAEIARTRYAGQVDGIYAFSHPFGCSQLGDDLNKTRNLLAGLASNPNAGGVLIIGLGCENNQLQRLIEPVKQSVSDERIRYFNSQAVDDEIAAQLVASFLNFILYFSHSIFKFLWVNPWRVSNV